MSGVRPDHLDDLEMTVLRTLTLAPFRPSESKYVITVAKVYLGKPSKRLMVS